MKIGIPKELKDHEYRIALTPEGVDELVRNGHEVWVETKAGSGANFPDDLYRTVGARIAASAEELFDRAELILKVKEPLVIASLGRLRGEAQSRIVQEGSFSCPVICENET